MKAKDEIELTLSSLTAKDWAWLEKFAGSPYHTADERILRLVKQFRLAKSSEFKLDAETVFPLFFTKKAFSARDWGDLLRKFLVLLRAFLWQQQVRQTTILSAPAAIQACNDHYLYPALEEQIVDYEKMGTDGHLPPWEVANYRRYLHQKRYESLAGLRNLEDVHLASEQLDLHFLLLRLRYAIERTFEQKKKVDALDVNVLLGMVDYYSAQYSVVDFYANIYRAFAQNNYAPEHVLALKEQYLRLYEELVAEDQAYFFVKLCTLYNRALLTSAAKFRTEQFRLYQFGVAEGLLLQNNKLYESTFLNVCVFAVAEEELEWATEFRTDYLKHLATDNPHNAEIFSEALLDFGYGRYGKAFRALGELRRPNLSLNVQTQTLQTKCLVLLYVEDQLDSSVLRARLDAYYRFVYRIAIPDKLREALYAFIRLLRLFIRLREKRKAAAEISTHLLQLLEESQNIVAREWLASVFTDFK